MRVCWPVFLLSLGAFFSGCASDSQRKYEFEAAPTSLFEPRPFTSDCAERTPGQPMQSGAKLIAGNQPPYLRTRTETLTASRTEIPALTIVADPANLVQIAGSQRADWSLHFCAQGEGNNEAEARQRLQQISMNRLGSAVFLNSAGFSHMEGARGTLIVDAPADAPVVVHASFAAVAVRDMKAPVRVTVTHGRATILNSSGKVDTTGYVVDFAGSRGTVILSADAEINLKLNTTRFAGSLSAWAQRPVRLLVPRGFQTPFQAMVERPDDFVCRADFCAKVKQEKKDGLYVFTYPGDGDTTPDQVQLRSEQATVVIDNAEFASGAPK